MPFSRASSKQVQYANNLASPMGLPLISPIPFREDLKSGRVGDIGWLDQEGGYEWVHNCHHPTVESLTLIWD